MLAISLNLGPILFLKIRVRANELIHGPAMPPSAFQIALTVLIVCVSNAAQVRNSKAHLQVLQLVVKQKGS